MQVLASLLQSKPDSEPTKPAPEAKAEGESKEFSDVFARSVDKESAAQLVANNAQGSIEISELEETETLLDTLSVDQKSKSSDGETDLQDATFQSKEALLAANIPKETRPELSDKILANHIDKEAGLEPTSDPLLSTSELNLIVPNVAPKDASTEAMSATTESTSVNVNRMGGNQNDQETDSPFLQDGELMRNGLPRIENTEVTQPVDFQKEKSASDPSASSMLPPEASDKSLPLLGKSTDANDSDLATRHQSNIPLPAPNTNTIATSQSIVRTESGQPSVRENLGQTSDAIQERTQRIDGSSTPDSSRSIASTSVPTSPLPASASSISPNYASVESGLNIEQTARSDHREILGLQRLSSIENANQSRSGPIGSIIEGTKPEAILARVSTSLEATLAKGTNGIFELKLQPAELGSVRIVMSHSETGLTATISAERQDVLDLLRRNGDSLLNELRNSSNSNVQMSFQEHGQQHNPNTESHDAYSVSLLAANIDENAPDHQVVSDRGLDIRL